jgi:hypothetical protein
MLLRQNTTIPIRIQTLRQSRPSSTRSSWPQAATLKLRFQTPTWWTLTIPREAIQRGVCRMRGTSVSIEDLILGYDPEFPQERFVLAGITGALKISTPARLRGRKGTR